MQITLTAKLKLVTTPEQFTDLRQTQLAYRDAAPSAEHKRSLNSELVWALDQYAKAGRRKGRRDADMQSV